MKNVKLYKFWLSSIILLSSIYIFYVLKGIKDTLILTSLQAELISTLKLYGVLPASILFTLFYAKLTNYCTRVQIYHLLNGLFITFFIFFVFFLYPDADHLNIDLTTLISQFPKMKYILLMVSNWPYSLFYIGVELWGNVMLALMFWQLANQIYSLDEAKKIYPLFGLLAEIGVFLSGLVLSSTAFFDTQYNWNMLLKYICISTAIASTLISLSIYLLSHGVVEKATINGPSTHSKSKVSLLESLKYIILSKPIALISAILFCYGSSINFVEDIWRKQTSLVYPNPLEHSHFIGKLQITLSITVLLFALVSFFVLPRIKWITGALITPIIMATTGISFFLLTIYSSSIAITKQYSGNNILLISVFLGALHNIMTKAAKYSFFDPTKEMIFIPLNEELKSKGKGIADIIGEPFGKAGSSAIVWSMLSLITGSTLITIAPYVFVLFLIANSIWLFLVFKLDKEIKRSN